MKILVVSQYYYPEPFRLHEICEELVRRGHEVTVVTSMPNYPDGNLYVGFENKDQEEIVNGVRVLRTKCRLRKKGTINLVINYFSVYINLNRRLKELKAKFDVVYTYQLSPIMSSLPALYYAKSADVPSLLYCLDLWPESVISFVPSNSFIFKCVKALSKYIYKKADRIAVTSPSFITYLQNLCKLKELSLVYSPQHSKDFGVLPKEIDNDCVNFVFLGNIGNSQMVDLTVRAAAAISNNLNFKVHIVGSGSSLDEVKEIANKLNVDGKVVFHGRQPKEKMPDYYKIADACIVSLRDEGAVGYTIPGKLQEYMSAGKAILGSINGDAEVVINDAKCGLCSKAEDLEGLKKNMVYMIEHKDKLTEWGNNARIYYEQHFTLTKHVDVLELEFQELLNK